MTGPNAVGGKSIAAFRTIGEAADEVGVPQHVLRFWETRFAQVRPLKRGGGRRYYRPEDVALLCRIRGLLHDEGYTIRGVQKLLGDSGAAGSGAGAAGAPAAERGGVAPPPGGDAVAGTLSAGQRRVIEEAIDELDELRALLDPPPD